MAANGISTLPTKQQRQIAKLDLAQTKRQSVDTLGYRALNVYNIDLLPAPYVGNTPTPSGITTLTAGRPWEAA